GPLRPGDDRGHNRAAAGQLPGRTVGPRRGHECCAGPHGLGARMSLRLARLLGVLLVVYGLIGVMAGLTGYLAVRASFEQARALGSVLSDEEASLRQDLAQVAATSGDAADAVDGFSSSLQRAQQSLATAGDAADQLSDGFQRAAGLGTVVVFGMRPFADVGQSFGQSSTQFHTLAGELRATSQALGSNALDARRVG